MYAKETALPCGRLCK